MTNVPKLPTLLILSALAACQDAPPEGVSPKAEPSSATTAPADPAPPMSGAGEPIGPREVTLAPDGIILVNAVDGRGAATTLNFGMPRDRVLAAMGEDFAAPRLSRNGECGAGPMEFAKFGALQLNFLDGKLAGWFADAADNLVTVDGIRPGVSLEDLKSERQVQMANDTLEGEFAYYLPGDQSIGGFVDREGKVMSLNAGVNCFFR